MNSKLVLISAFLLGVVAPLGINGYFLSQAKTAGKSGDKTATAAVDGDSIKKYLTQNPEVILQSIALAQKKVKAAEQARVRKLIVTKLKELEADPQTPHFGSSKADITLVLFSDYNCGYCKQVADEVQQLVKDDKNVKVVHKDFPILAESSVVAAKASLAAYRLNPAKYAQFHFALLAESNITEAGIIAIATKLGYDAAKFKSEMQNPAIKTQLAKNQLLARTLGINGTPAFVLAGELIPGAVSVDVLKQKIAAARTRSKSAQAALGAK